MNDSHFFRFVQPSKTKETEELRHLTVNDSETENENKRTDDERNEDNDNEDGQS